MVCYDDPKDPPIERPAKIDPVVNLKAAKAPGLTRPNCYCYVPTWDAMDLSKPFDHSAGAQVHDRWRTPVVTTNGFQERHSG